MTIDPDLHILLATDLAVALLTSPHSLGRIQGETADDLMRECYSAIEAASTPAHPPEPEHPKATAAEIRKSIQQDHLVSFEDGKKYKMLKRHLRTNGLTPEAYREKWGLPADYPMTAPSYSATRSKLAMASGLGTKKAGA